MRGPREAAQRGDGAGGLGRGEVPRGRPDHEGDGHLRRGPQSDGVLADGPAASTSRCANNGVHLSVLLKKRLPTGT